MSSAIIATDDAATLKQMEREVERAFHESPLEGEMLVALLNAAAFSRRASTALEVVTRASGAKSLISENENDCGDVDVNAVRCAVTHVVLMTNRPSPCINIMNTCDETAALRLVHTALYGGNSPGDVGVVLRRGNESKPRFSVADRMGRSYWRFDMNPPTQRPDTMSSPTLFHGSPVENWLSILHGGLRVLPASHSAVNGRVYGEGVYLARNFDTAASFAPMTSLKISAPTRLRALCVVGEFCISNYDNENIRNSSSTTGNHTHPGTGPEMSIENLSSLDNPHEYVVVQDPSQVRLVALHVLANLAPDPLKSSGMAILPQLTGRMSKVNKVVSKANAFWVLIISYMLWLVWLGQNK